MFVSTKRPKRTVAWHAVRAKHSDADAASATNACKSFEKPTPGTRRLRCAWGAKMSADFTPSSGRGRQPLTRLLIRHVPSHWRDICKGMRNNSVSPKLSVHRLASRPCNETVLG